MLSWTEDARCAGLLGVKRRLLWDSPGVIFLVVQYTAEIWRLRHNVCFFKVCVLMCVGGCIGERGAGVVCLYACACL